MARLPDTYQEVEYIESSWTQYINTQFTYTQTTWEVKTKMMSKEFGSYYHSQRYTWAYSTNNTRTFMLYNNTPTAYIWIWGDDYSTWFNISTNTIYDIDAKIETAWICVYTLNGQSTTISYSGTIVTWRPYFIFCDNENSSPANYWKDRLYYFKMYEAWSLVRDFVPCYRKSDWVIGMYDLVNDTFYTNSWTWTFIKGGDVLYTGKIQKMFLWQSRIEYQIYPPSSPENWVLFTETDLSTGNLGLFSAETTSWDWNYSRPLAPITNDWQWNYYYQTFGFNPVCLRLRGNYPTLMSIQGWYTNRKVKVVYDYLCIAWNSSQGLCGRYNRDSSYGPCLSSSWNTNRWAADANVVYTAEIIMNVGANTESWTIFLKSDWSKVRDFWPNTMPTATSWTYHENDCWLWYGTDREEINIRLWNVHIFTYDY